MAKANPFMKKAKPNPFVAKVAKPNPFVAKAKTNGNGNTSPERMAELRNLKALQAEQAAKAERDALPYEVKLLEKRCREIEKEYEAAQNEAAKLFKKVDSYDTAKNKRGKKDTEEYRLLVIEWDKAELRVMNKMAQFMGMLNALRVKRHALARR